MLLLVDGGGGDVSGRSDVGVAGGDGAGDDAVMVKFVM